MGDEQSAFQSDAIDAGHAIDDLRVVDRAKLNYFRFFGESYKGHYRGAFVGIVIGGLIAAGIAAALCALPVIASAGISAGFIIPAFAGIGALLGAEGFSVVGSASASRATALAEKHARLSDPVYAGNTLAAIDDKLMPDGRGYHYEFPHDRDKGRFYNLKSGITGALITGGLGALLGVAGELLHFAPAMAIASVLPLAGPALVGAIALGIIGLSFGIERSILKSIFNQTDANTQGRIHDGRHGPDLGREQFQAKETESELLQHRLRRQSEIVELGHDYDKKIFWGAVAGRFRGFAGGITAGAIVGAVAGALTFGVVAAVTLLSGGAVPGALALLGTLTGAFAAAGGLLGMGIFAEAGTEAGAESTARAIDDEFERNRLLKAQGITPPEHQKHKKQWFSVKSALVAGALGTAVGVALGLIFGHGILAVLSIKYGIQFSTMAAIEVSAIASGLVGVAYGITYDSLKLVSKATNWIYDKAYFRPEPELEAGAQPAAAKTPAYGKITAEENARLNERMNASAGKNFSETISQQLQTPTVTLTAGM